MTVVIYYILFITFVTTVSDSLLGKNPAVLSLEQRENKTNFYP